MAGVGGGWVGVWLGRPMAGFCPPRAEYILIKMLFSNKNEMSRICKVPIVKDVSD